MKRNCFTKSNGNFAGLHWTTDHSAKMQGLASISTDINTNPICQGRRKINGSICQLCFSARMWDDEDGQYRHNNEAFKRNTEILCSRMLEEFEIPVINPDRWPLVRFEAFADLQSVTQFLNYCKIARLNPGVKFALWTKNPGFVAKGLRIVDKPKNLQIVLSSMGVNRPANGKAFSFVDKVFTVYDDETIQRDGVSINCGARSCMGCQICYKPNPDGVDVLQVRERVK